MGFLRVALIFVLAVAPWGAAWADEETDAVALVQEVRAAAVAVSFSGTPESLSPVIAAAFDGQGIAQRVLGDYWTTASQSDRDAVVDALLDGIGELLADRLMGTTERDFAVLGTRVLSNGDVLVRSQFVRRLGTSVNLDWRLRQCEGELCIGDVFVDGASLTIQRRDEVMLRLANNGGSIPQLLADIREGRM